MNGNEIPTNPAIAMGSFSSSDILSVFVEKNSSGSSSRVNDLRSGSPPNPMLTEEGVRSGDDEVAEDTECTCDAEGAKAVATVAMASRTRRDLIMVLVYVLLQLLLLNVSYRHEQKRE